jgi:hypothetical protein
MAKFSEMELSYNKAINDNINNTLKAKLEIDNTLIKQIADTQKNLLMTETAKTQALEKIKTDYRNNVVDIEDTFMNRQMAVSEDITKKANALEEMIKQQETDSKAKFQDELLTGNYFLLTESQKAELARKMGMEPADIQQNVNKAISTSIRGMFDQLI